MIATVHIDRRNTAPRRLDDRQALDPRHAHAVRLAEIDVGILVLRHRQQCHVRPRGYVQDPSLRIHGTAFPIGAADGVRQTQRAHRTVWCVRQGWGRVQTRAQAKTGNCLFRQRENFRRKIDQIFFGEALPIEGRRPCGKRLCGGVPFTGYISSWNRQLFDRPDGFASLPIEGINIRLFGNLHYDLSTIRQIRQDRCGWVVPVPDVVMNQLVVPAALASLDVQSHQGVRKKIVTGSVAAEAVAGGRFHWQVDQA